MITVLSSAVSAIAGFASKMVIDTFRRSDKREEELLHMFREKIKIRPVLKVLTPGTLPPQIRFIEDKRNWD